MSNRADTKHISPDDHGNIVVARAKGNSGKATIMNCYGNALLLKAFTTLHVKAEFMDSKIRAIKDHEGQHISVAGGNYRIIISGEQTAGELAIIDMEVPPGSGPGPHAHPSFHETFYVVDGELEFRTEEGNSLARKGDVITIPKGAAVHGFKNVGDGIVRLICMVVPAGLDAFFREIGVPVKAGEFLPQDPPDKKVVEQLMITAKKYGQVVYPPDYLDR